MNALEQAQAEIKSFRYLSKRAKDVLEEKGLWAMAGSEEFLVDHLKYVMPNARAYNEMMERHNGCPVGFEYEHSKNDGYFAVVLPDASHPGKFRVQFFDKNGFSSHDTIGTIEQASEELVKQGFRRPSKGAMTRLSQRKEWEIGNATTALLQQLNAGKLSYGEFLAQRDALYAPCEETAEFSSAA